MAAGFISEWGPASNRNGGRLHVGIPGRNKSESAAVNLQDALEALQMGDWPLRFAIGCVDIHNARWITAAPWSVVGGIGPKLTGLGAAPAGIQHGRRRLVRKQAGALLQPHQQPLLQRAQVPGGMANPVRQRGSIQIDSLRKKRWRPIC